MHTLLLSERRLGGGRGKGVSFLGSAWVVTITVIVQQQ